MIAATIECMRVGCAMIDTHRLAVLFVSALFASSSLLAADSPTGQVIKEVKDLTVAPLHWDEHQWLRFGEGVAAVAAVYAADHRLENEAQQHRSSSTDRFARTITPFGAQRALEMSALMIVGGALSHDATVRDAGTDSLASELWAAGVVTPIVKFAFGRARPSQEEGAHSFHPFSSGHESIPSGHATNAFAFATAVAGHSDNWIVPAIVYTMATGVALARVNDRQHFPSDVLAGALIGHAVGKGIVARHRHTRMTLTVAPAVIRGRVYPLFFICSR